MHFSSESRHQHAVCNPEVWAITPFGTYACVYVAHAVLAMRLLGGLFGWLLLYFNGCAWLAFGIVFFAYGRNKVCSSFV